MAAIFRFHKYILKIDAALAQESRKIIEIQCEPHGCVVSERHQCMRSAFRPEQSLPEVILARDHSVLQLFVEGQLPDQMHNRWQIAFRCWDDSHCHAPIVSLPGRVSKPYCGRLFDVVPCQFEAFCLCEVLCIPELHSPFS